MYGRNFNYMSKPFVLPPFPKQTTNSFCLTPLPSSSHSSPSTDLQCCLYSSECGVCSCDE